MHAQLRDTNRHMGLVRAAQLAGEAMAYAPDDDGGTGSAGLLRTFALLAAPLLAVAGAVAWIAA